MASGSIEGRHLEASDDGAGCGARGRETNAPPTHSGGAGAPPGGQYEPPARSWLTVQPLRLARSFLPERPRGNAGKPGRGSRQPRIGKPPIKTAARKARPGAAIPFTTVGEAEEDGRK